MVSRPIALVSVVMAGGGAWRGLVRSEAVEIVKGVRTGPMMVACQWN